jgi:thiamine phosphate synthase YjbQ (UPF0047 family)
MHVAQARLSIDTAPREIKEITTEVAQWTERQRISVGLLRLQLGTWQGIFLLEHRASPHSRAVVLTLIGEEA